MSQTIWEFLEETLDTDTLGLLNVEVDRINATHQGLKGDLVASWASDCAAAAIIEQLQKENAELRAERDALGETLRQEVEEMQEFIDKLWQAVILDHKPDYGDWEYPDQAHRHIVTEVTELRAELAAIKPSWKDAPDWADTVTAQWIWLDEYHIPQNALYVEIYRTGEATE